jgi:two-component system CheB/CheR fusion protein
LENLATVTREVRSQNNRWYETRVRPYRTVEDKIDGIVITFIDISERRATEIALRESEQKLRQEKRLVELSREPIFVWDFDDGILEWNRGSEELYGYSREEALGKQKEKLLGTTVPGSSFEELKATLLERGNWSGELRQRSKSGDDLVVESRIELMPIDGKRFVLESTRNISDRKQWEKRQHLLLGELTHRVKNTLTVVQAIAHQTQRHSGSTEDFIQRFDGRLEALASAHGLLVESNWVGADVEALARNQLRAYTSEKPVKVLIEGEPVLLPAELATPFGLVLHELATNAAKYGALSTEAGTVKLSWALQSGNESRVLTIIWQEQGGPTIKPSRKKPGFGTALIDNGIPDAVVHRDLQPEGLICKIVIDLPEKENGTVG